MLAACSWRRFLALGSWQPWPRHPAFRRASRLPLDLATTPHSPDVLDQHALLCAALCRFSRNVRGLQNTTPLTAAATCLGSRIPQDVGGVPGPVSPGPGDAPSLPSHRCSATGPCAASGFRHYSRECLVCGNPHFAPDNLARSGGNLTAGRAELRPVTSSRSAASWPVGEMSHGNARAEALPPLSSPATIGFGLLRRQRRR